MTASKPPAQIETCRLHDVSFTMRPGESTSSLVHRYTDFREEHQACVLDEAAAETTAEPAAVAVEG